MAIIGQTSKAGRPNNAGEESQDIDWDNLPAPLPSKKTSEANITTAPNPEPGAKPHPKSDFWGGSQCPEKDEGSQLPTSESGKQEEFSEDSQDDGGTIGGSQEYGRPKSEANSEAGKAGTGKKPGDRRW